MARLDPRTGSATAGPDRSDRYLDVWQRSPALAWRLMLPLPHNPTRARLPLADGRRPDRLDGRD